MKTTHTILKIEFLIQTVLLIVNAILLIVFLSLAIQYSFLFFCISQLILSLFQYGISMPLHFILKDHVDKIRTWRKGLLIMGCVDIAFIVLMNMIKINTSDALFPYLFIIPQVIIYVYYFLTYKNYKGIKSYIAHEHILNTKF